ncbi:hypothetical protein BESB_021720 [Besnoitia besnoiti]|uniref:Transmembrane protein n=1 Tax=Besnoitia besnoiti TaxID=94643 RepID=A0A2A9M7F4_BESBE|nr:hypothetical protein BESB_021720 [Besnoitia besnoiti]PFH32231.1 hypothetical protein BESB_021720 [Besnoitia besnoiti]
MGEWVFLSLQALTPPGLLADAAPEETPPSMCSRRVGGTCRCRTPRLSFAMVVVLFGLNIAILILVSVFSPAASSCRRAPRGLFVAATAGDKALRTGLARRLFATRPLAHLHLTAEAASPFSKRKPRRDSFAVGTDPKRLLWAAPGAPVLEGKDASAEDLTTRLETATTRSGYESGKRAPQGEPGRASFAEVRESASAAAEISRRAGSDETAPRQEAVSTPMLDAAAKRPPSGTEPNVVTGEGETLLSRLRDGKGGLPAETDSVGLSQELARRSLQARGGYGGQEGRAGISHAQTASPAAVLAPGAGHILVQHSASTWGGSGDSGAEASRPDSSGAKRAATGPAPDASSAREAASQPVSFASLGGVAQDGGPLRGRRQGPLRGRAASLSFSDERHAFSMLQMNGSGLALAAGIGGVMLGSALNNGYPLASPYGAAYPYSPYAMSYYPPDCAVYGVYPGTCDLTTLQLTLIIFACLFFFILMGIAIYCCVCGRESRRGGHKSK